MIRGTTDQLEAAIAYPDRGADGVELHEAGEAAPPADLLGRQGRTSPRAAEHAERRADALGQSPKLNDALGRGKIGAEHADAVASAAGRLDDDQRDALFEQDREITEFAASHPPEVFRRRLATLVDAITDDDGLGRAAQQDAAATASLKIDDDTGLHLLFAELTPEQGNRIRRALDAEVAVIAKQSEFVGSRRDQLLVRALGRLVCGTSSTTRGMAMAPQFRRRRHDVMRATRASSRVVMGGQSQPLDVGRARRLATPPQRTALRAMYRTCAINGCDQHVDRCHIHHIAEWDEFGLTAMEDLVPLCSFQHHRVHEGRWRLQLDASTRQLTVTLPDGTVHSRSLPDLLAERNAA